MLHFLKSAFLFQDIDDVITEAKKVRCESFLPINKRIDNV